jgi:N-acetylglucosaminyl-diphospho-decaprenol L-rhamnosyltransferase
VLPELLPDVAVIIVTYNSAHVVGDLLDSLPAALDGLAADVVVVDNGSADETVQVLAERADCRLVRSSNTGYAAGINRGVRAAISAEAILVLNPDVRLHEKSVAPVLGGLQ